MDQEIELAEPNFIPLAPEEAADAVRLLAALIRAVPGPNTGLVSDGRPGDDVDQQIELADPDFIPLHPEEAAEAIWGQTRRGIGESPRSPQLNPG
ncbi:MAG TPA: hypothetical protein VEM93_03655 [Actinomycetota bacterium]|nr:hypothetical protein [Actinomycetota bacterium]